MEIIKNFGINPILLGAQIVNFLIVLYFLRRFLYKPILEVLKKRQDLIKDGIQKSEEANVRLAKVLEEEKAILKNAQLQAKKIISDAKEEIIERSKAIEENAQKHAERILNDAKGEIEREAKETERKLTINISGIAVSFLEKSLRGLFSEKEQKELVTKALKKFKK